jgi:hypothetical protein
MSSTIRLPSGKLIDLSRFVALLPDEETTEKKYKLSLDGANLTIDIDATDAEFISSSLKLIPELNSSHVQEKWNKEEQLRKNEPLMKLIKQWREQENGQPATAEEIQEYQEILEALKRNRSTEQISKV